MDIWFPQHRLVKRLRSLQSMFLALLFKVKQMNGPGVSASIFCSIDQMSLYLLMCSGNSIREKVESHLGGNMGPGIKECCFWRADL